ncbi:hypothetical protein KOW79_019817 [Hemibagrus wyckioides]|uniref:Ig-like domain-containing protein n=1 Tax=Hemibagrus wyckioides TaxID=337641 RepID=A0A9D3N563_9TELE|nr:hypothetical protein KOW79_019817 [Hemibagrus wyckioides]
MTTLFVALCVLFSLFTAVNSSDIKELHVRTVKSGEDVTMECNISSVTKKDLLVWYRQSSGKLPQYFVKPYQNNLGYKFAPGFNDSRFSISVNDDKFDLNINKTRQDDEGQYFCGEMEGTVLKFTSGTRLQFKDDETPHHPTSGTTFTVLNSSIETCESCTANMRVFFWLSISRIGVLCVTVIILTIWCKVLKSKS